MVTQTYSYYAEFAQSCLLPGIAAHFLKIQPLFVAKHIRLFYLYIYIQFIESHIIHNNPSLICL